MNVKGNEEIEITDAILELVFIGCNFGGKEKTRDGRMELVKDAVFKNMAHYWNGHTIHAILEELRLVNIDTGKATGQARRWCYQEYNK